MVYMLECKLEDDETEADEQSGATLQEFPTLAAWKFCGDNEIEILGGDDWTFKHPQYGEQSCYDIMVPAGDDWEVNTAFINFMTKQARSTGSAKVECGDDNYIHIYSKK